VFYKVISYLYENRRKKSYGRTDIGMKKHEDRLLQGCQMVYIGICKPKLGIGIVDGLVMDIVGIFSAIWYIFGHLVYFWPFGFFCRPTFPDSSNPYEGLLSRTDVA
jgi:hypothetical protein